MSGVSKTRCAWPAWYSSSSSIGCGGGDVGAYEEEEKDGSEAVHLFLR